MASINRHTSLEAMGRSAKRGDFRRGNSKITLAHSPKL
jgi:hypothetical protein